MVHWQNSQVWKTPMISLQVGYKLATNTLISIKEKIKIILWLSQAEFFFKHTISEHYFVCSTVYNIKKLRHKEFKQ